ncbi:MAG: porphobilinogen synthase [Leptospiraceae bacterium]|nr:porphobilinogen synthase [Leptospiraceae bacterium]
MIQRPRRNRRSAAIRALVRENQLTVHDLIYPVFLQEGRGQIEIASMPGIYRYGLDALLTHLATAYERGIQAIALFVALPDQKKDDRASESKNPQGLYQQCIRRIKSELPEMLVITDVAMDPYSSDGHDGLLNADGEILNDATLPILTDMAVSQAQAGADIVAPSDMMDGRVAAIRLALDHSGHTNTGILAYTAKYASAFYGPFRDALDSAPRSGDKKTYQMDPANRIEAVREAELDLAEGADLIMVKPGLPYLDVIRELADISTVPVAAYNVSGEYAMLKAAALNGWLDYRSVVLESLTAFKRAGASLVLSYHSFEVAGWLSARD